MVLGATVGMESGAVILLDPSVMYSDTTRISPICGEIAMITLFTTMSLMCLIRSSAMWDAHSFSAMKAIAWMASATGRGVDSICEMWKRVEDICSSMNR